jgi:hypothetical protein
MGGARVRINRLQNGTSGNLPSVPVVQGPGGCAVRGLVRAGPPHFADVGTATVTQEPSQDGAGWFAVDPTDSVYGSVPVFPTEDPSLLDEQGHDRKTNWVPVLTFVNAIFTSRPFETTADTMAALSHAGAGAVGRRDKHPSLFYLQRSRRLLSSRADRPRVGSHRHAPRFDAPPTGQEIFSRSCQSGVRVAVFEYGPVLVLGYPDEGAGRHHRSGESRANRCCPRAFADNSTPIPLLDKRPPAPPDGVSSSNYRLVKTVFRRAKLRLPR